MTPDDQESQLEVAGEVAGEAKKLVSGSRLPERLPLPRKRATRSPHPGVVLLKPRGGHPTWRARCEDPDTGKRIFVRLDPMGAGRNAQTRRRWAIEKAQAIAKRKGELSSGAPRATGTGVEKAVERYFEDHPQLRPRTLDIYRRATNKLLSWAAKNGLRSADDLTGPKLVAFRASLMKEPKRAEERGQRRGSKRLTEELRKPNSVNIELRAVGTVLGYLRRLGLVPRLSLENLVDGLRKLPTAKEATHFLRTAEIRQLLDAASAHDVDTFKATRAEHGGEGEPGSTPRYQPITPFILVALLSGMRFSELAELDWSEVDLAEGEIRLGSRTKTKHARTVSFEVSPALGEILRSLHTEGAKGRVWSMTVEQIRAAAKRLERFVAPQGWSFQVLRRTCGTYLTNAPGIFGAASAYRSARQLGHSVQVAERHYLGVVKVPKDARTLEEAMNVNEILPM